VEVQSAFLKSPTAGSIAVRDDVLRSDVSEKLIADGLSLIRFAELISERIKITPIGFPR